MFTYIFMATVEKDKKQKKTSHSKTKTYPRPVWVKKSVASEEELCPDCFRVVGVQSRYKLVCLLGKAKKGESVGRLTEQLGLKQPTITHHLNILKSVDAVDVEDRGRERIYTLNRGAHCFEECQIPY
jgi:DNA-binding transcriptional ArsR family regulator